MQLWCKLASFFKDFDHIIWRMDTSSLRDSILGSLYLCPASTEELLCVDSSPASEVVVNVDFINLRFHVVDRYLIKINRKKNMGCKGGPMRQRYLIHHGEKKSPFIHSFFMKKSFIPEHWNLVHESWDACFLFHFLSLFVFSFGFGILIISSLSRGWVEKQWMPVLVSHIRYETVTLTYTVVLSAVFYGLGNILAPLWLQLTQTVTHRRKIEAVYKLKGTRWYKILSLFFFVP